jgi:two-component system, LytTR family, sensor kinase
MTKKTTTKHRYKEINLLFHIFIIVLAIVIDLPNSINFLKTPADVANYAMSRVFLLISFYACYFWFVPHYLAKKKILSFFVLLIVLVNLITFIGYSSLQLVHAAITGTCFQLIYTWPMHFSGMFGMIMASILGTAFRTVTGWYEEMQKKSMLEQEKLQSELLLLKAQVNPHFLFNTLNTIDFLIYSDQHKASESLIKLSTLLRYVIYDTVNDLVPLQQEIEQMEAYIDLQRLRYGENANVSYVKTGDLSGKMVAPMLFIPFIENSFKHTDEAGIKKGMMIRFHIHDNSIEFTCENHISLIENKLKGGLGLVNVNKRLEMQYPDRYTLSINENEQIYSVALKLELK